MSLIHLRNTLTRTSSLRTNIRTFTMSSSMTTSTNDKGQGASHASESSVPGKIQEQAPKSLEKELPDSVHNVSAFQPVMTPLYSTRRPARSATQSVRARFLSPFRRQRRRSLRRRYLRAFTPPATRTCEVEDLRMVWTSTKRDTISKRI